MNNYNKTLLAAVKALDSNKPSEFAEYYSSVISLKSKDLLMNHLHSKNQGIIIYENNTRFLAESALEIGVKEYPELWKLSRLVGYQGRKLSVETFKGPMDLVSYWQGGSRDFYYFVELSTNKTYKLEDTKWTIRTPHGSVRLDKLPDGIVLIRFSYYGSLKDCTIFFNSTNITKAIAPPKVDITEDEFIVLHYTKGIKSQFRLKNADQELGFTKNKWDAAKNLLISKKLLNASGAITPAGMNVYNATKDSETFSINQMSKEYLKSQGHWFQDRN